MVFTTVFYFVTMPHIHILLLNGCQNVLEIYVSDDTLEQSLFDDTGRQVSKTGQSQKDVAKPCWHFWMDLGCVLC